MNIQIHRADSLAGETLIEISTAKTKILLDCGTNLDDNMLPNSSSLNKTDYNAAFLLHAHTDYVGLANETVYLSQLAGKMITAAGVYKMQRAQTFSGFYQDRVPITVGDITVTPILVDQQDYEAYLFLIAGEGKCLLYTGDYCANGRKSFEEMLRNLPAKVDGILCAGIGLTHSDMNPITERDLEEKVTEVFNKKTGPVFVLQSVTDIDRTTTLYHAAKRCSRLFLEDLYMANIADTIGNIVPNPNEFVGVKAFLTTGYQPNHIRYQMFRKLNRTDKNELPQQKFVMCVRPNMKKYLKSLAQLVRFYDGVLVVSLPIGEEQGTTNFIQFAQNKGLEVVHMHTSGHADARALQALVDTVHPTKIIPLHIENANWFDGEFPGIPVIKEAAIYL